MVRVVAIRGGRLPRARWNDKQAGRLYGALGQYGTAIRRCVLTIAILAALTTACSSSHAAGSPASTSAPTQASVSPVIVLVHGFSPSAEGYSCADYWEDLEAAFRQWDPGVKLVTVGFVRGDHDCDMTVGSGGPYTPIEDIGRELATDVYQRFSARGTRSR